MTLPHPLALNPAAPPHTFLPPKDLLEEILTCFRILPHSVVLIQVTVFI